MEYKFIRTNLPNFQLYITGLGYYIPQEDATNLEMQQLQVLFLSLNVLANSTTDLMNFVASASLQRFFSQTASTL